MEEELQEGQQVGIAEIVKDYTSQITEPNPVKLDLGSGFEPLEGFIGLDFYAEGERIRKADLFADRWIVEGETLAPDSVDFLYSSHFVEHVPDWDKFFAEAYRVLKPGARFFIITPYYSSVRATQDPDHKQMISEARYSYLNRKWRVANGTEHYPSSRASIDFEIEAFMYDWHADYRTKAHETREFAKLHYSNVVNDIVAVLRKR